MTNTNIFGKAGELIQRLEYEDDNPDGTLVKASHLHFDADDNMVLLSNDSIHRWLEPDHRSVNSSHWHGVSDAVIEATATSNGVLNADEERLRQMLWDDCVACIKEVSRLHWEAGDRILVSAASSLSDSTLVTKHPSKSADSATKGLIFCSTLGSFDSTSLQHHESWDVVLVPLQSNQGRLLAMLRMVPLAFGRSDVTLAIVNGDNRRPHNHIFQEMEKIGETYGTHKSGWNAANLGRFWAHGYAFEHHHEGLRYMFAKYGHVYGSDEVWLLAHSPIAVVSPGQMSARRAVCWKPKTVVVDMKWIVWNKNKGTTVHQLAATSVKDLLRMERDGTFVQS